MVAPVPSATPAALEGATGHPCVSDSANNAVTLTSIGRRVSDHWRATGVEVGSTN